MMKLKNKLLILSLYALSFFCVVISSVGHASVINGGMLILNLDRDALIANVGHNGVNLQNYPDSPTVDFPICCRPSIYLEEFYDASAASKTFVELRDGNTPDLYDAVSDEISSVGLQFSVNPEVIATNPAGRLNKPTSINFDPTDITGTATGKIGLAGVLRFRVDVDPPTNRVLFGDLDLEYNPLLEDTLTGRSGWVIMNNSGFRISGFDLFDVTSTLTDNNWLLTGALGLGQGFDHLGGITDSRVGTFNFQATVVPLPTSIWLFVSGLMGLSATHFRIRRNSLKSKSDL